MECLARKLFLLKKQIKSKLKFVVICGSFLCNNLKERWWWSWMGSGWLTGITGIQSELRLVSAVCGSQVAAAVAAAAVGRKGSTKLISFFFSRFFFTFKTLLKSKFLLMGVPSVSFLSRRPGEVRLATYDGLWSVHQSCTTVSTRPQCD